MNMKNVTKTGLNEFIARKVKGNKEDVKREINLLINEKLKPIFDAIDCSKVERHAQNTVDEMSKVISIYAKPLESWKYTQVIQDLNRYAVNLGQRVRDEIKLKALEHIEYPQKNAVNFGISEVDTVVSELQTDCKPLYQKINSLTRLQKELEQVIKNEHNGGRAYKALIALGVDMEGFSETPDMLPAIVKLSVDVCVLNGDCEKKVSA